MVVTRLIHGSSCWNPAEAIASLINYAARALEVVDIRHETLSESVSCRSVLRCRRCSVRRSKCGVSGFAKCEMRNVRFREMRNAKCPVSRNAKCEMAGFANAKCEMAGFAKRERAISEEATMHSASTKISMV